MLKFTMKRLVYLVLVLVGVSFLVFLLLYMTPGDPVRMMLGESATPEAQAELRLELGLDDPFLVQYGRYIKNIVVHQDLGTSYSTRRPVLDEIMTVFPNTVKLATAAIIIAVILGTFLGIVSAVRQNSLLDNAVMVLALIGTSAPIFWIGILMIILFSVNLGWLPPSGFGSFKQLIMPALALGMQSTAVVARMTRSSMLEVIRQDFVKTARAKGQKESVVIMKHVFRNALIPVITVVGLQFGTLLGGAMLTEVVFSIPGVGRLMIEAIKQRDFPIVQGSVLFVAACFSLVNSAGIAVIPGGRDHILNAPFFQAVHHALLAVDTHGHIQCGHSHIPNPGRTGLCHTDSHGLSCPVIIVDNGNSPVIVLCQHHHWHRASLYQLTVRLCYGNGAQYDAVHLQCNQSLNILKLKVHTVVRILNQRFIPLFPQVASDAGHHTAGHL